MGVFSLCTLSVCLLPLVIAGLASDLEDPEVLRSRALAHDSKATETQPSARFPPVEQEIEEGRSIPGIGVADVLIDVLCDVFKSLRANAAGLLTRSSKSSTPSDRVLMDEVESVLHDHQVAPSANPTGGVSASPESVVAPSDNPSGKVSASPEGAVAPRLDLGKSKLPLTELDKMKWPVSEAHNEANQRYTNLLIRRAIEDVVNDPTNRLNTFLYHDMLDDLKSQLHGGEVKSLHHDDEVESTLTDDEVESVLSDDEVESTLTDDEVESVLSDDEVISSVKSPGGNNAQREIPVDHRFETIAYDRLVRELDRTLAPSDEYYKIFWKYGVAGTPIKLHAKEDSLVDRALMRKLENEQFYFWFTNKISPKQALRETRNCFKTKAMLKIADAVESEYDRFINMMFWRVWHPVS